jgi:DNA polymerase III alpha subunit
MKSDKFSNVIYETSDIVDLIYKGQENLLDQILCEPTDDIKNLAEVSGLDIKYVDPKLYEISVEDFDRICQQDWFMPEEYQKLDIEELLVNQCPTQHYQRLIEELQEYRARNMLPLLKWLKYLVDTCRSNNIVWGVGRGSSVSSYVLFLIGVHKIDPIKYNLDWRDFLR